MSNDNVDEIVINVVNLSDSDWILAAQLNDDRIKYLNEVLSRKPVDKEEQQIYNEYLLKNNCVHRKTVDGPKWMVPKSARKQNTDCFYGLENLLSLKLLFFLFYLKTPFSVQKCLKNQ